MRTTLQGTVAGSGGSTVEVKPERAYGIGRDPDTVLETEEQTQ